jgi:hypothetical protein
MKMKYAPKIILKNTTINTKNSIVEYHDHRIDENFYLEIEFRTKYDYFDSIHAEIIENTMDDPDIQNIKNKDGETELTQEMYDCIYEEAKSSAADLFYEELCLIGIPLEAQYEKQFIQNNITNSIQAKITAKFKISYQDYSIKIPETIKNALKFDEQENLFSIDYMTYTLTDLNFEKMEIIAMHSLPDHMKWLKLYDFKTYPYIEDDTVYVQIIFLHLDKILEYRNDLYDNNYIPFFNDLELMPVIQENE